MESPSGGGGIKQNNLVSQQLQCPQNKISAALKTAGSRETLEVLVTFYIVPQGQREGSP